MTEKSRIWFPAKKYGYGWGLPCAWQGWVVMLAYVCLVITVSIVIDPALQMKFWFAIIFGLTLTTLCLVWRKGEKPTWRWGNKK